MLMSLVGLFVLGVAILAALYFLAPGLVLKAATAMARRRGRLQLRHVDVDGHRIAYLEGGSGAPLLLIHGFGANKDHWTMIAPFLTAHFQVYALDLPGCGDSTRRQEAHYGTEAQLARLEHFAAAVGLSTFHLGGNSMGGYLAAMYAARHHEQISSLWLLAPAGALSAEPSEVLQLIDNGENPLVTATMAEFERLADLCFTVAPSIPSQFKRVLFARARDEAGFNEKMFAEMFTDVVSLEEAIAGLETRSLIVWGDGDRILHRSGLEIIHGLLANAQSVLMPRMGHVPMIERPRDTAADYLQFRGVSG
jgi:abhydrolase domain-containing protein 6